MVLFPFGCYTGIISHFFRFVNSFSKIFSIFRKIFFKTSLFGKNLFHFFLFRHTDPLLHKKVAHFSLRRLDLLHALLCQQPHATAEKEQKKQKECGASKTLPRFSGNRQNHVFFVALIVLTRCSLRNPFICQSTSPPFILCGGKRFYSSTVKARSTASAIRADTLSVMTSLSLGETKKRLPFSKTLLNSSPTSRMPAR